MKFSERLKQLRSEHGLSQQQLAIKTGISRNCLAAYESGRIEPSLKNFLKIISTLGINICYSE